MPPSGAHPYRARQVPESPPSGPARGTSDVTHDVFLSYNNRDYAAVETVARSLREQGLSVFVDRWYLAAGMPWPEHLEEVLGRCRAAAVFLGPQRMGRWQQREQYLALDRQARDPSFPVIPVLLPGSDPALGFLSLNTWVDLRSGVGDAESLKVLADGIQGKPPGPDARRRTVTARSTISPYRGLRFFRDGGRQPVDEGSRPKKNGASSSFAAAQVALRDVLARALEKQPGMDRLMLVVDQWEELYTLTRDQQARERFLDEIVSATTAGPLSVVLTLRGDFLDQVLAYRPISDALQDAVVNIGHMTRRELVDVIERPAEKVLLRFEPGLANRIIEKVERQPGNLPLLEFVLAELWKERQDDLLTHQAYEDMGELQGAIATHAESVFGTLPAPDRELGRRIFLQLVRPGGPADPSSPGTEVEPTRRRTSFRELAPECIPVVRRLADAHLLVTGRSESTGEEFIDLVHEALIEAWSRLRDWIDEDREFLTWREQLRSLVAIAAAERSREHVLLRRPHLAKARNWMKKRGADLSTSERAFVQQSLDTARRRTTIAAAAAFVVALVLGLAWLELGPPLPVWAPFSKEEPEAEPDRPPVPVVTTTAPFPEPLPESRSDVDKIRNLLGVTTLDMNGASIVAVLGPPPTDGVLKQDEMIVLPHTGEGMEGMEGMDVYVSALVQCVRLTAPKVRFAFVDEIPDVPLGDEFMTVSGVDLTGRMASYAVADARYYWAPGVDLPLILDRKTTKHSGTGSAAAVAAGVALRPLDGQPGLKPADVLQYLRATSRPKVWKGPPVLDLNAALALVPTTPG